MSHYNGSNSWQNPKPSGQQHHHHHHQQQQQQQQQTSQTIYNPAANLLAQFAAVNSGQLSSHLSNLAANLPVLVAQSNALQQSAAAGYQWHSQNKLVMANAANKNASNSAPAPNTNNSNSYHSNSSSNYHAANKQQPSNSSYSNGAGGNKYAEPKSLMDMEINKRNSGGSGNNQTTQRYNDNKMPGRSNNNDLRQSNNNNPSNNNKHTQQPVIAQALLNQMVAARAAVAIQTPLTAALNRVVNAPQASVPKMSPQNNINNNNNNNIRNNQNNINNRASSSQRRSRSRSRSGRGNSSNANNKIVNRLSNNNNNSNGTSRSRSPRRLSSQTQSNTSSSIVKKSSTSSSSHSRYTVRLPKHSLDAPYNNVISLKARYSNLYVPSDFTNVKNSWLSSLPLNRPLKFNNRCLFHIMHRETHAIEKNLAVLEPADLDHRWNVKVMLLAMPSSTELFKRCCSFAEDSGSKDLRYDHPSKIIQFLVGSKGKHELMALGGPWSPSLDGPNPGRNMQTLINCAVRNVKALTGIDLSACTQWFRFLDIQYNRNEGYKTVVKHSEMETNAQEEADDEKSQSNDAHFVQINDDKDLETTVMFLPNVWSLMPTSEEYKNIVEAYKEYIENPPDAVEVNIKAEETREENQADKQNMDQPTSEQQHQQQSIKTESTSEMSNNDNTSQIKDESSSVAVGVTVSVDENDQEEGKPEPTHYSKLDLKKMRVDELRAELEARNLDTKGLKQQLIVRLREALEDEQEKDGGESQIPDSESLNTSQNVNESASSQTANNEDQIQLELRAAPNEGHSENDVLTLGEEDSQLGMDTKESAEQPQQPLPVSEQESVEDITLKEEKPSAAPAPAVVQPRLTKTERERFYKLPTVPHLIVHANREAKAGKFDCQLVSLSHLLDYRKDDNKECSFEVFLFAECFNEMLLRDFGFQIYKHILTLKESSSDSSSSGSNNKRKLSDSNSTPVIQDELAANESKKARNDAGSPLAPPPPPPPCSGEPIAETDKDETKTACATVIKLKPKTIHPELLLAFTYLDTHRSNHIHEKDLEDLILLIGLNLTRSKARALLKKLTVRDSAVNYRSLTDSLATSSLTSSVSCLALNVSYGLPDDEEFLRNLVSFDAYMRRVGQKEEEAVADSELTSSLIKMNACDDKNVIVEIEGQAIDVLKTTKKLDACEASLQRMDAKLKEATDEIDRLKITNKSADRAKQRLQDEIDDYKKKLREQQRTYKEIDEKYSRVKDCLYKTRSYLNRALDDVNDTLKRGLPPVSATKSDVVAEKPALNAATSSTAQKSEESAENQNENNKNNVASQSEGKNEGQEEATNNSGEEQQQQQQQQEEFISLTHEDNTIYNNELELTDELVNGSLE